jgi:uncharacterized membrane protein (DUF106 family)
MFETTLNPVFSPLLKLPAVAAIGIISLLVSFIITIVYKYMTDQVKMKDMKMRQKELQKQMKANRGDPQKLMKIQKEAMDINLKYMTQSFKPTLVTFIPIIIIFAWLNSNMAYEPIMPGQEFTTTVMMKQGYTGNVSVTVPEGVTVVGEPLQEITDGKAEFKFTAESGDYLLVFNYKEKSYEKELTVTNDKEYAPVTKILKNDPITSITLSNQKLIAINIAGKEEGGVFSGRLGWLGTYILFSLLFSIGLRKVLNIY